MNAEDIWQISVICGINQRYHQYESSFWAGLATWTAIAVAFAALASFAFTIATYRRTSRRLAQWSIGAATVSMFLASALNISPFTDKQRFYSDTFRRWSDLRQEADCLLMPADAVKKSQPLPQWIADRYTQLLAKKDSLNAMEPAPNRKLLEQCQDEENQFRGIKDTATSKAVATN